MGQPDGVFAHAFEPHPTGTPDELADQRLRVGWHWPFPLVLRLGVVLNVLLKDRNVVHVLGVVLAELLRVMDHTPDIVAKLL